MWKLVTKIFRSCVWLKLSTPTCSSSVGVDSTANLLFALLHAHPICRISSWSLSLIISLIIWSSFKKEFCEEQHFHAYWYKFFYNLLTKLTRHIKAISILHIVHLSLIILPPAYALSCSICILCNRVSSSTALISLLERRPEIFSKK